MKPIPAIVEKQIDLDLIAEQIIVAHTSLQDANKSTARLAGQLASAQGAAKARRLEIGRLLDVARPAFGARGPAKAGAQGWSDFLVRVGLDDATARRYQAEFRDPEGYAQQRAKPPDASDAADDAIDADDGQTGPRVAPPTRGAALLFAELTPDQVIDAIKRLKPEDRKRVLRDGKANLQGGSGEVERGTWCPAKEWAVAVGPWEHDPFSNPRSHILSVTRCMLEDGGDGFGGGEPGLHPGHYLLGERHGSRTGVADELTRVWLQPRYDDVLAAIAHYGHTRFGALLRLSPDVEWFRRLWPLTAVIAIPLVRLDFEPPPGVAKPESSISYPHALYYACEADVTADVRARCIVLPVDHGRSDPESLRTALRLVR